ncbi:oxidoreductase [Algivirga pacifica]|uniref:Oxidoreductase n=1 Tax=Algivirga pacifica TaxID=1162670 RepID=A0ABP9DCD0_9BACT
MILACRNLDKGHAAQAKILQVVPQAQLAVLQVDLSSLASVRHFAEVFQRSYDRLDILINNAGIMIPPYAKTEDGFESQMGANYFGHFLLTGLLLEVLKKTEGARVVSLSSIAHKQGRINFDDIHWEERYSAMEAYGQSKVACLIFATELQRRLEQYNIEVLSVAAHPGVSPTELGRHVKGFTRIIFNAASIILGPVLLNQPKEAALPTLMAALNKDAKGGDYYGPQGFNEMKGKPGIADRTTYSKQEDVAKRLWELSEQLTGITYPFEELAPEKN